MRAAAYQALYLKGAKKTAGSLLAVKHAVPLLIEATKDSAVNVRFVGEQGLSSYGAAAKEAVPALTALLDDPEARIRQLAQTTLDTLKAK